MRLKKLVKLEIHKAFYNKFFIMTILIGCAITMLGIFNLMCQMKENDALLLLLLKEQNNGVIFNPAAGPRADLYHSWIFGEPFSLGAVLYTFLFPVLLSIPYGWSYCEERSTGYIRNMVVKSGKREFFVAKYIATFLAGGVGVILPLIVNFVMVAMMVPARKPMVRYETIYGVFGGSFLSELFYSHPLVYVCVYLFVDFVFAGLLATLSIMVAMKIRWKWVCVLSPFLICMLLDYLTRFVYVDSNVVYKQISLMYIIHPIMGGYPVSWSVILLEISILFGITFIMGFTRESKHEIY